MMVLFKLQFDLEKIYQVQVNNGIAIKTSMCCTNGKTNDILEINGGHGHY